MKTQIPLYRAKKIGSDRYIEGLLTTNLFDNYCIKYVDFYTSMYVDEIDPSTLAIHFPDMIDSEGTRIFASLSEDGKGGSIINDETETMIVKWDSIYRSIIVSEEMMFYELNFARVKVIGIQE